MSILCKYCNSENIIKFGSHIDVYGKQIQRYFCKDCGRKFVPDTLPKMQTPTNQVSAELRMYYAGMSLDGIQGCIKQEFGNNVAESTIYYWITRFTKEAIDKAKDFRPKVGDVWIADETGIDIHGSKRDLWFWDVIDAKSRYLLASHISRLRTTEDAEILIEKAIQRAGRYPRVIITDRLRAYIDGVDLAGHDKIEHIRSKPFTTINSTNKIERFHGTFKDRTKVVRGFKNLEAAKLLTDGWLIHYNFFKEHELLGNVPPAVKMGIELPFKNWADIVGGSAAQPVEQKLPPPTPIVPITRPFTPEQTKHQYYRLASRKYRAKKKLRKLRRRPTPRVQISSLVSMRLKRQK